MNALVALINVFEVISALFAKWRNERQFQRRSKLESDALAYEKLVKATIARNRSRQSRLSRAKDNNPARGKSPPDIHDQLRDDKYRRD